jgi:NTP pyrophosphatase (non-canonical NTP hydrolase)
MTQALFEHRPPEPWQDIDRYAKWTETTWTNTTGKGLFGDVALCALGLGGETGEALEVLKKSMRDGTLDHEKLVKELGDVIYYWARLCDLFEIRPTTVLKRNVEKLTSRLERGVINGAGDNR